MIGPGVYGAGMTYDPASRSTADLLRDWSAGAGRAGGAAQDGRLPPRGARARQVGRDRRAGGRQDNHRTDLGSAWAGWRGRLAGAAGGTKLYSPDASGAGGSLISAAPNGGAAR